MGNRHEKTGCGHSGPRRRVIIKYKKVIATLSYQNTIMLQ